MGIRMAHEFKRSVRHGEEVTIDRRMLVNLVAKGCVLSLACGWSSRAVASRGTLQEQTAGAAAIAAMQIRYENNAQFDFSTFRGRMLILNFWAFWCSGCIAEFDSMARLQLTLGGASKVAVVLVSDPRFWGQDRAFAKRHGIPFMLAYYLANQTSDALARAFLGHAAGGLASFALPVSYVFAPSGQCAVVLKGSEDWMSPQNRSFWLGVMSR
jgi:thiol-disulfide isomerase/thioredoxin